MSGLAGTGQEEFLSVELGGRTVPVSARVRLAGGDLVVLLHGLGCGKESFDGAFDAAGLQRYSLCAFDFPGHGLRDSPGHGPTGGELPASCCTIEDYAEITRQVIAHMASRAGVLSGRVVIARHSMGGAVGVVAAPGDAVDALVSIDGNLTAEDCGLISRDIAGQSLGCFLDTGYRKFLTDLWWSGRPDLEAWGRQAGAASPTALHPAASLVEWTDSSAGSRADGSTRQVRKMAQFRSINGDH